MWQNAATKKQALSYLAQAQMLLPKVGIDDNPGDGGPDDGKLRDDAMGAIYAGIARAQVFLGQEAAAKATLLKAQALIPEARDKKRARHGLLDELLDAYVGLDWLPEAVTLHRKYQTYPERVLRLFTYRLSSFPEAEARAMLQQVQVTIEKYQQLADKVYSYAALSVVADRASLPDEKNRLFALLEPLATEFLKRDAPDYRLVAFGPLCQAIALGLRADTGAIEKLLQSTVSDQPGWAAMGYLHLGKKDEAKKALAALTKESRPNAFPPPLAALMAPEDYIALIKRTKNTTACTTAALSQERKLPLDLRIQLLQLAATIEPEAITPRDWQTLLTRFAYQGADPTAFTRIRALLRKNLPESEKYWRSRPGVGGLELSLRQSEWTEIVEQTAKADPPTALRYLPRITEPRRRLPALVALAEAEAWRARPRGKGDLG
jgi:hypothetical protein